MYIVFYNSILVWLLHILIFKTSRIIPSVKDIVSSYNIYLSVIGVKSYYDPKMVMNCGSYAYLLLSAYIYLAGLIDNFILLLESTTSYDLGNSISSYLYYWYIFKGDWSNIFMITSGCIVSDTI